MLALHRDAYAERVFWCYSVMTMSSGAPFEMSTISLRGRVAAVAVMKLRRLSTVVPGGKSYLG